MDYSHLFTFESILKDVGLILVAFCVLISMAVLRGGHGMESIIGIGTCSTTSWLILILAHAACFGLSYVGYRKHNERLFGKGKGGDTGRDS